MNPKDIKDFKELKEFIDYLLSPECNYNILVVIGPTGCGKTTKVKNILQQHPDYEPNYFFGSPSELSQQFTSCTLDSKRLIRVIDPADGLKTKGSEIPSILTKFRCKYIIVADSLKNLPSWCSSTKVLRYTMRPPSQGELYDYMKSVNPNFDKDSRYYRTFIIRNDAPEFITNYYEAYFYVITHNVLELPKKIDENSPWELVKMIRAGEDPDIPVSPFHLEMWLNGLIGYPDGIEAMSVADMVDGSTKGKIVQHTPNQKIQKHLVKLVLKNVDKFIDYRPQYKKKEKIKEVEEEIEIGVSKKVERPHEKIQTVNLFDFV
jgi:energy-coupling factor transporter ATP-binding protein EcfA2